MAYEIRYTRLTNSVRLTDRYLTVQVKNPTESEKSQLGTIFVLVEINNPWFPNSQIGQNIINTLAQEYYKQPEGDALTNFENSLKKVNQNLAKIAQEGETNWMGNLNAVLMLVSNDDIHMAKSGKGEAFLLRDKKIRKITDGSSAEMEPNPIKTFVDIVSGELNKNDKILITSPALLDYLSQKEIEDIMNDGRPYDNTVTISEFLKKEKARHINSIVLEAKSKTDIENEPLDKRDVVYLDQVSSLTVLLNSTKKYSNKIGPFFEDTSKKITEFFDKSKHFFKKEISPRAKSGWEKTKEISRKGYNHLTTKTAPEIQKHLAPISKKIKDNFSKHSTAIMEKIDNKPNAAAEEAPKTPYSVHYYEGQVQGSKNDVFHKIKLFFGKILRKIRGWFDWLIKKENRSVIYVIIAVILVTVLVISIGQLKKKQNIKLAEQAQAQTLDDINTKYEEAKLAILYNEPEKAAKILDEVISKATEIMTNFPALADKAKEIIQKANIEYDKLTQTTRFDNPTAVAQFADANNIFVQKDKIIALNNKNNNIYYTNSDGGEVTQTPVSNSLEGIFKSFGFDSKDGVIYAMTDKNQLYKTSDATQGMEKITPLKGVWENSIEIGYFLGNIYLLDPLEGQIWKHTSSSSGFGAGTNYVDTGKVDLKSSISMAIDGQVFILKKDNSIIKLSKGVMQDFSVHNVPEPMNKITDGKKIWTSSEINSLFILDGNRILELDKDGKFIHQYAFSPDISNISDFFINAGAKKIWILSDNKVYKAEY